MGYKLLKKLSKYEVRIFLDEKQRFSFANFLHLRIQGSSLTHSALDTKGPKIQVLLKSTSLWKYPFFYDFPSLVRNFLGGRKNPQRSWGGQSAIFWGAEKIRKVVIEC